MASHVMPVFIALAMLGAMLYGAIYPDRFVAARRAAMSPRPLDSSEVKLVRALALLVALICMWTGFATEHWLVPLIFVPLSASLVLLVELSRMHRFSSLAKRQLPVRLIGVGLIVMAIVSWLDQTFPFAPLIAVVGTGFIIFPKLGSRVMTMGFTEQQEIVHTRIAGIIGSITISGTAIAVLCRILRHHLPQ